MSDRCEDLLCSLKICDLLFALSGAPKTSLSQSSSLALSARCRRRHAHARRIACRWLGSPTSGRLRHRVRVAGSPRGSRRRHSGPPLRLTSVCGKADGRTPSVLRVRVLTFIVHSASPRDPLVLAGAVLAMSLLGLVAPWIPAQRALREESTAAAPST
jgi:hypothetical protein